MRHGKLRALVPTALIPKHVEVDTARTPPLVGNAMATETTLRTKQDAQQLGWRQRRVQAKRGVQVARLRRPQGLGLIDRGDLANLDPFACIQQTKRATDRRLPRTKVRPHPNDNNAHGANLD
jgi:hypothetical protein